MLAWLGFACRIPAVDADSPEVDFNHTLARYGELGTESLRGLPRPEDDKYAARMAESAPVYAVWGRRRG